MIISLEVYFAALSLTSSEAETGRQFEGSGRGLTKILSENGLAGTVKQFDKPLSGYIRFEFSLL
jgi:hypothetical protein